MIKKIYYISQIGDQFIPTPFREAMTIRGWRWPKDKAKPVQCYNCHHKIEVGEPYFSLTMGCAIPVCLDCTDFKWSGGVINNP